MSNDLTFKESRERWIREIYFTYTCTRKCDYSTYAWYETCGQTYPQMVEAIVIASFTDGVELPYLTKELLKQTLHLLHTTGCYYDQEEEVVVS